jgi:Tol biopolymer transport system component
MALSAGTPLGPYRILGPLGAGGMGEVYRAHDTRLGRDVALKVLSSRLAPTPEVRARFEREARTISQLNHPNICTLFDAGREDGTDFLVMELLEGETLAQRLERGPLPLADIVSLGRQVAGALARAHAAGVVHRDLKPGNIMLTRTGAKLMDFGLARAQAASASTPDLTQAPTRTGPLTSEGTLIGTFQYMAPEQLEGKDADARADLWALGCLLYEMTTGVRAFAGESQASLIAAIMTAEPLPVAELRPETPPGLDALIRRCLAKRPEERVQSALDVGFVLELAAGGGARGAADGATAAGPGLLRAPWALLAAGLALAAAAFWTGRATAPPEPPGSIRVSTLSQGNRDSGPAVSPDGRMVAFSAVRQNGSGLWLMDLVTRTEVKLTSGADQWPRFTPDGGSITFSRLDGGRQSLWRVPVIGGRPRLLLEDATDADHSPDGASIAYIASTSDSSGVRARLVVARADGTGAREYWSRGSVVLASPRWSPDGRRIALISFGSQNTPYTVVVVDVSNGTSRDHVSPDRAVLSNPVWDGTGRGLLVAQGEGITALQRGAPGRLFRLDVDSGSWRALGWLENYPTTIDVLPDGRLVLSSFLARQNLCEVAADARDLNQGRWLTSGLAIDRQPVYSPDGKSVMFSSNRGGTLDLWEVSVETGEIHRVTDDPADDWDPEYSPDGRSIYWCSGRSGVFEIWTARRDGSAPRQLSRDSLDAENPSVSPDERWIYYSSSHPRKAGLWRIPADGGEGEWLLNTASLIPDLSPDGRHLSAVMQVGTVETMLGVFAVEDKRTLPGSVPLQVITGTVQPGRSRFTPDASAIAYLQIREDGQPVLLRRPLSAWRSGTARVDTLFAESNQTIESFGFSPDGRRAAVSVVDWLSGLTIAEAVPGMVPPRRPR